MLQMTFSEHRFWLMSFWKKNCSSLWKGVHFENYSLIIVTDMFPIYKVLCLPRNEECPLLFCGWQKMFYLGYNFWKSESLSEPLLITGKADWVKPVGNGAHRYGWLQERSNFLISQNNLTFHIHGRWISSVSPQLWEKRNTLADQMCFPGWWTPNWEILSANLTCFPYSAFKEENSNGKRNV